ncbi:MAG: hypothetical protein ACXVC3_07565 [Bdellovibrio sp.]
MRKLKKKLIGTVFFIASCWITVSAAASSSGKTLVVYFGQVKEEEFQTKVKPLFLEKSHSCKKCEIENHTHYDKNGAPDLTALREQIESLPADTSFVFFDFNLKVSEQNKDLVQILNQKAKNGLVVVGTAGVPKADEASSPLSRTLLGQIEGALIIGELGQKDRLIPTGFYGPEMLTALRPPKDLIGQGYSPLIFAATLADRWGKRNGREWVDHFHSKKMKSRKIWMDLEDLF